MNNLRSVFGPFFGRITKFFHERSLPLSFIGDNSKMVLQGLFTIFSIGIGIWFFNQEKSELVEINHLLRSAGWQLVLLGLTLTALYIVIQGYMYVASFATFRHKIPLRLAITLFLKRNFISVFLPAGGVSSLVFFTSDIEKRGITKSHIHFASTIYGFVGILSVVLVAIPAFIYAVADGSIGQGEWIGLFSLIILLGSLYIAYRSFLKKGPFYLWLIRFFPSLEELIAELDDARLDKIQLLKTLVISIFIEFIGIAHLYVAMMALHVQPSLFAAFLGYIISVIFLIISPFLRGLGPIEISMVFVLAKYGFSNVEAIAITFLYRFFEFWMPLLSGAVTFLLKINKLIMRIIPALLLFALGIVNIISVLTPAIRERVHWLKNFIPVDAIVVSNYFVLVLGLILLVTASFMLRGLRSAWYLAVFLTVVSFFGNLFKAADYEEALIALFVLGVLIYTRKDYYVKNNPRLRTVGIQTAVLSILAVMLYSVIGFYYLDKKHFNIDFSLWQSFRYALQNYFLVGSSELIPVDRFASRFILSINVSGFLSLAFLFYTLIRPYILKNTPTKEELERPNQLLRQFGHSSLDYFKTYQDKMVFEPEGLEAFVSYRIAGNYAVVLENPVAENAESLKECIRLFDRFCYENGLKSFYYRVPEDSLPVYKSLKKKSMFLGQEGVVDLNLFSLEGGARKSIRNAISKVKDRGYTVKFHFPPIKDGQLQKVKSVSDDWLYDTGRSEIIFSQGMFDWEELKQQTLITVENSEERVVAFLNIIPDYAKGESTYDLLRKTKDAPNGVMDFILIEMFNYLKSEGFETVNLGFAPMSGLKDPTKFSEKSMKFAYEKIRNFAHYKGMREYKEKFATIWYNKYLIYDHDYDLMQLPRALSKVIEP
ncbi:MAG TPA: phosphatidylglycerol lysyltransferase domain-containing protein [Prolixibacteraceae bacterium]